MVFINIKTILLTALVVPLPVSLAVRVEKHADLVLGRSRGSQPLLEARHPTPPPTGDQSHPPPPPTGSPSRTNPSQRRRIGSSQGTSSQISQPNFVDPTPHERLITPYLCGGHPPTYELPTTFLQDKTHVEKFRGYLGEGYKFPHVETTFVDDVVAMGEEGAAAKKIRHHRAVEKDIARSRARRARMKSQSVEASKKEQA